MPISRYSKAPVCIGITMGDPAGIGPEIIAKSLPVIRRMAPVFIFGDSWVLGQSGLEARRTEGATFVDLKNIKHDGFSFGAVRAAYGRASVEYLEKAMEFIRAGRISCLVTAPVSKEAIHRAGFPFSGHTEYLADRWGVKHSAMMLVNKRLRFVLVTRHVPIAHVSRTLTAGEICRTVRMAAASLRSLFGLRSVRLVVCGLNPHASDNGVIGREENEVIKPALKALRIPSCSITGPLPADAAIAAADRGAYDCIIAMYHDQALIPLKLTDAGSGVNVTLGLPFVRTSPLHGTAFDIAGHRRASPDSLIASVKLALSCVQNLKKASARTS